MLASNVSIFILGEIVKPHPFTNTEQNKDTKTLDYESTPLDVITLLFAVEFFVVIFNINSFL
jgi:hypothetical protein